MSLREDILELFEEAAIPPARRAFSARRPFSLFRPTRRRLPAWLTKNDSSWKNAFAALRTMQITPAATRQSACTYCGGVTEIREGTTQVFHLGRCQK